MCSKVCVLCPVFTQDQCSPQKHVGALDHLVGVEEYRLPIAGTDVVLPTPDDYSGTFQGEYSARVLYPLGQLRENTAWNLYKCIVW